MLDQSAPPRPRLGLLGARLWVGLATVALLALTLVIGLRAWNHHRHAPDASARGLFPALISDQTAFNHKPVRLLKAWAATPGRSSFEVTIPATRHGQYLFVLCGRGDIALDFGGSTAGAPCSASVKGVIGYPSGPSGTHHVRVSVDEGQLSTWGFAVYEPAG